jgi:hypothetical protein
MIPAQATTLLTFTPPYGNNRVMFDSRPYQIFLERGPISLVRTIEELLE